ncbi:MAG TPA: GMC family oxidoreductase [Thermoanaerobaculaceae bacterium]|nr:GMC family oxidoreductase [Thermoanaerobaculaceae bacterium]
MDERSYDVVVVGSGAGGGTVAKELAPLCRDGMRVAVLEWGPKLREDEYTGREAEMAEKLYFDNGGFLTRDGTMTLAFGRAYGGSTVVYTGTSLALPEEVLARWGVPGLEHADLRRRSEKYLGENNVHLLEDDKINDNNRLFLEACRTLCYRVEQFPVNVKGCRGSGLCNLGCPNAAKQGTHRVQLPAAEAAGVEVVTNCKVERIGDRECVATVANPPFGEPSRWPEGRYRIRARAIVVAAGAVNSPALLLRSGLPVRLPALGRYFTAHPALILVGEHDRPITNFHGHPKSYYCDHFVESAKFLLETCMYFPFTTAKNLIGFGSEHAKMMGRMDRMQMILVLAVDPALPENRVRVNTEGEPVVHYRFTDEVLDALVESQRVAARIFFAAGCRRVHAPGGRSFSIGADQVDRLDELITRDAFKLGKVSISSAHLMGGCRMGTDRATSVTDAWGQVHGVPWLFVADASLFPMCSEINPYVTIMALADRVAERVRDRLPELSVA